MMECLLLDRFSSEMAQIEALTCEFEIKNKIFYVRVFFYQWLKKEKLGRFSLLDTYDGGFSFSLIFLGDG